MPVTFVEASDGVREIGFADDVVPLENRPCLVTGHLHRDPFWHASPHEVANCRASEVVRNPARTPGLQAGRLPRLRGANAYTIPNRLPMMVIYTKRHYSVLAQDSDGRQLPRQAPPPFKTPGKPTDAEKIALYEHWATAAADAGTYELQGTRLIQRQVVTKDGMPVERIREITIEGGGNTLVEITKSVPGQPVRETRRTFTRLE